MEQPAQDAAEACLLLLSGLPGAGKTTLARCLAREACREGVDVRHVCFDELGCQLTNGGGGSGGGGGEAAEAFSPEAWQLARRAALEQLELELAGSSGCGSRGSSEHQQRHHRLPAGGESTPPSSMQQQDAASGSSAAPSTTAEQQQQGHRQQRRRLVIADDNLQYRSMRWQCYGLVRAAGAAVVLLHVRCSEQLAQERNAARPEAERVPEAVISRMAAQFEAPGSGSGSVAAWEQACLVECSADRPTDAAAMWQRVQRKWGAPAPPPFDAEAAAAERAAAQAATAASRAHAVDVATRQVLSQAMQRVANAAPAAKAAVAQQLNAARRQLLQEAGSAQQAAPEQPGGAAERWAAAFQQRCEAILASLT